MAELWPVLFLGQQLINFFNAKIASQKIVVVTVNQLRLNCFGYKQYTIIISENPINFLIAVDFLLSQSLGLKVSLP